MIQEPGIVPRDPEPDGAWAGSLASNCRAPEWAGPGSPRGSPGVGGLDLGSQRGVGGWMQGHPQRLLQTQRRLPPRVTAACGRGWGKVLLAGPEGRPAASFLSPGGSQLAVALGACQEVYPSCCR